MIGDDGGGPLHHRHPVRVRRLGDENCAVLELLDLLRAADEADPPCNDGVADAEAFDELPPLALDTERLERARLLARLDGLRPGLNDVDRKSTRLNSSH